MVRLYQGSVCVAAEPAQNLFCPAGLGPLVSLSPLCYLRIIVWSYHITCIARLVARTPQSLFGSPRHFARFLLASPLALSPLSPLALYLLRPTRPPSYRSLDPV